MQYAVVSEVFTFETDSLEDAIREKVAHPEATMYQRYALPPKPVPKQTRDWIGRVVERAQRERTRVGQ